jgi:serine/threonine protein kinase
VQPDLIGGRYRVRRAVGKGGMGTVWLCRDETLDRDVAVKQVGLLPGESSTDTARALREARATAALNHPHVVAVHDVVQENGAAWLVMEYVPSRTLAQIVAEHGPLEPGRVAAIGAQVAAGLLAAHGVRLTHRDVKPGNVLVGDDGSAKIGDFGLSRTSEDTTLTSTGMISGTPGYLAPEVARGSTPSPGSDAWALGATLYAAVEGRAPYGGENALAVLHQIAHEDPARPQRAGTLEPVIAGLMARDPAERWSLTHAHEELRRLAARPRETTRELAPPTPNPTPTPTATLASVAPAPADDTRPATPAATPAAASTTGPTAPPTAPPTTPPGDTTTSRRRRPGPVAAGVLALLVAVAAVFAVVQLTDGGPDGSGSPSGAVDEPTADPDRSRAESPTQEPEATDSPPADEQEPGSASDSRDGATSGDEAVAFVDGYFDTVPGDVDTGWAMLSPAYQAETGRESYDGFWAEVADVDATDLSPAAGGDAVEATVTYEYTDGRTVEERQLLQLVPGEDGEPRIDGYQQI